MLDNMTEARQAEEGYHVPVQAVTSKSAQQVDEVSHQQKSLDNVAKFGSAENNVAAEVAAHIAECDRINGVEDLFGSVESRIREKFKPVYKVSRRANADPAYCAELAKQLLNDSGGKYTPSAKKPASLAASLALKPKTEAHKKQTYDAAYYLQHAAIEDVSLDDFAAWIDGRSLKESIAFVRARTKLESSDEPKQKPYPNIAKAKKLKQHEAAAKILKDAFDMAEDELKKLFDRENVEAKGNA